MRPRTRIIVCIAASLVLAGAACGGRTVGEYSTPPGPANSSSLDGPENSTGGSTLDKSTGESTPDSPAEDPRPVVPHPDCTPLDDSGSAERTYSSQLLVVKPGQVIETKIPVVDWCPQPLGVTVSFLASVGGVDATLNYDDGFGFAYALATINLPDRCWTSYPFYADNLHIRLTNNGAFEALVQITAFRWIEDAPGSDPNACP